MLERRVLPILFLASLLTSIGTSAAGPSAADVPARFNSGLDGRLAYTTDATSGAVWAAWAYQSRGEYDVAVSVRDPSGTWSEPTFFGRLDGLDQVAPALVSDPDGNLYVAFAVQQTSQILLSVLPRGSAAWTAPLAVTSPGERGFAPALTVAGDRLVVGYRTIEGRVALRVLPLAAQMNEVRGIYDAPDGTDPIGMTNNNGSPPSTNGTGFGTPLSGNSGPKK
ncbi:MAG: hypothetical protein LAO51_06620 [Acidobacteriia bacterium]|nr:hypothetical protein [Terriglobia bacterium]